jgi:putative addiction module component (TIGR02574 family)
MSSTLYRDGRRYTISAMATQREQIFRQALELDLRDQSELLTLLIERLDPETEAGVQEAWMQEIDRRVEQLDNGTAETVPWDVVRARLKRPVGG